MLLFPFTFAPTKRENGSVKLRELVEDVGLSPHASRPHGSGAGAPVHDPLMDVDVEVEGEGRPTGIDGVSEGMGGGGAHRRGTAGTGDDDELGEAGRVGINTVDTQLEEDSLQ